MVQMGIYQIVDIGAKLVGRSLNSQVVGYAKNTQD